MNKRWTLGCSLALLWASPALAQSVVDLSAFGNTGTALRTQILVLGTVHLSGAPKEFKPDLLEPLLDKLAAFRPQIITIEQISGEGCDLMERHPAVYSPEDLHNYCSDSSGAKAATGLDVPAAIAEVERTLKDWPAHPTAVQRRHLAAVFLAANDSMSASVQWLQLPASERLVGDGVDAGLAARLERIATHNNESYQIAARLAARLGLQRLYSIDDHTGDNVTVADDAAFGKAVQRAWDGAAGKRKPISDMQDALLRRSEILELYRYTNRPDVLRTAIESDFGAALGDPSPEHYGQLYVAGWETRNLRMVSNVHAAFRESPGARVLAIVGSSHKPWFDSLLGQMQRVQIVDVEQVLK